MYLIFENLFSHVKVTIYSIAIYILTFTRAPDQIQIYTDRGYTVA